MQVLIYANFFWKDDIFKEGYFGFVIYKKSYFNLYALFLKKWKIKRIYIINT